MPVLTRFSVLALLLIVAPVVAQPLVLTGATVYDGTGADPMTDAVIVIEDERIACIGADCMAPDGAEIVDLAGRFVTPGLVDAHVHFQQTGWLDGRPDAGIGTEHYDFAALQQSLRTNPGRWHRAFLCSGITAVYDVGGYPWTLDLEAEAERNPERARVRAAGPLMTAFEPIFSVYDVDGENTFYPMQTDEEAVESIRRIAEMGSRAIKVWYLDPPAGEREVSDARLLRIGEEARAQGLSLIVHPTELRNAKVALRAGAAMLVHSVMDEPVDDEFIRLAREAGTIYAPTLIVMGNWTRAIASVGLGVAYPIDDPNGCVDSETRRVIAEASTLTAIVPAQLRDPASLFGQLENSGRRRAVMEANLTRVHTAGIPVVTSTDAGNPLTVHGPSIYPEMEAMEAAGIPPAEVLVMSTHNGATAMGRDDFGTIEAGKLADLIILTEDPGASTTAFRSISHVMRGGVLREIAHFAAHE